MRNAGLVVVIVSVVAGLGAAGARGTVIRDPAKGALGLTLTIYGDGSATLTNTSGMPMSIDAYEIMAEVRDTRCGDGRLDRGGWVGIGDMARRDPAKVMAELGPDALGFVRAGSRDSVLGIFFLTELSLGSAVFQPDLPWSLGQMFAPAPAGVALCDWYGLLLHGGWLQRDDYRQETLYERNGLRYRLLDGGGNAFLGVVQFEGEPGAVPEPMTLALLGIGGWAVVGGRRRQNRRRPAAVVG